HPAPQLRCSVTRRMERVSVSEPFATAIWEGRDVLSFDPRSQLRSMLCAQIVQADGAAWRNILRMDARARINLPNPDLPHPYAPALMQFSKDEILRRLSILGLPSDASLSGLFETLPVPGSQFVNPSAPTSVWSDSCAPQRPRQFR